MKKVMIVSILFILSNYIYPQQITAEEVLKKVDRNFEFGTAEIVSELKVYENDEMIIYQKIHSFAKGKKTSFAEVLSPARDAGTKFLKVGDLMWMYLPDADRVIKISGHLLRQSMLGSDFSYEDAMEGSKSYEELYNIEKFSIDTLKGKEYYKITLTAKDRKTTYYKRILWIDKENFIPMKEERFSRQGKLLKVFEIIDVEKFGNRFYPVKAILRDVLRKNTYTEMNVISVKFDITLSEDIFTRANLTR